MKRSPHDRRPTGRRRGASPTGAHRRGERGEAEQKYHGRHACHALFQHRRDDIVRVYLDQERVREFSSLLKWCAEQKRAYHIVEEENLERLAETVHHQGIVVLARKPRGWSDEGFLEAISAGRVNGPLLYLDGVQNPHNVGAILRTSAHFGVGAVLGRRDQLPGVTASAARVAEGGAETVPLVRLAEPEQTLAALKHNGYRIYATASGAGANLYRSRLVPRSVIILGNEVQGVTPAMAAMADESLLIPGTGAVESLNVGVACAVLLSEVARGRFAEDNRSRPRRSR
jgi:RNA methyltransferase, TrmH family